MGNQVMIKKEDFENALAKRSDEISVLLGNKPDKAEKFITTAVGLLKDTALSKCTLDSLVDVCLEVAETGLSTSKSLKQVYIYPYGDKATYQIGYMGWISIFARFGYEIRTDAVYSVDDFSWRINGFEPDWHLDPKFEEHNDLADDWVFKNLKGVVVQLKKDGDIRTYYMKKNLIEKRRLNSPSQYKINQYTSDADKKRMAEKLPVGIYEKWYEEMSFAKTIKNVKNNLALDDSLQDMITADDKKDEVIIDVVPTQESSTPANALQLENNIKETLTQDEPIKNDTPVVVANDIKKFYVESKNQAALATEMDKHQDWRNSSPEQLAELLESLKKIEAENG